jgi:hypothetical protein
VYIVTRLVNLRTLAVAALVLMISAVAYGFAAANTVPVTGAGDGAGDISGYTVANVDYNLDTTNPANIASVALTLTPNPVGGVSPGAPRDVRIKLTSTGTTYATCTGSGFSWSCTMPANTTVLSANQLTVIAVE